LGSVILINEFRANTTNDDFRMTQILFKELSYETIGVCFKTHNELGRFRNEKTYADHVEMLLQKSNIKYLREAAVPIRFENETPRQNRPDFVIESSIVLDLKAKTSVTKEDYFQMKRYLTALNMRLGIIVNFRSIHLTPKRILNPQNM